MAGSGPRDVKGRNMEPVVFRKMKRGGRIIALFPQSPAGKDSLMCRAYTHRTGVTAVVYRDVYAQSVYASPTEYAGLQAQMEDMGFNFCLRRRVYWTDHLVRYRAAEHEQVVYHG